jgi:LDH2 family malate/lactate/ureidoglycolate dehydrogenase
MLDADRPDGVRLSVTEAHALGEAALRRIGYPADEATIVTDQLIDNALCGYRFASLPRILAIAADEKTGKPRSPMRIVRETPVSATVDGGNKLGYVAAYRGAEIAIAKAKASGIAIVGVHNSYYSGRNAYYVERIVREGLVAIHTASARPHVLPPGGRRPALGTNPFSIGFPSANGPVIYDIGTASLMWGEVLLMARLGQMLPEGVGFDADGNPTRDARAVAQDGGVTAFGGHKGYGLSFAIQALGLLAGPKRRATAFCLSPLIRRSCCRTSLRAWRSWSRASRRRHANPAWMPSAFHPSARSASASRGASRALSWTARSLRR